MIITSKDSFSKNNEPVPLNKREYPLVKQQVFLEFKFTISKKLP